MSRRRLDAELVRRRLSPSRAAAQRAIMDGYVVVEGVPEPKPATLIGAEVPVRLAGEAAPFVSRGGEKLAGALDGFAVDPRGLRALDAGASTGGFTDCLLQRGASAVVAVDVGYGQLHWKLQSDPRVTPVDRTNLRNVAPEAIGAPFDVIVCDLSFISLASVAQALASLGAAGTEYVLLVKPQFEVGKGRVGSGGIVREPALHVEALQSVTAALDRAGLGVLDACVSPIVGAKGNREFFVWARHGPRRVDDETLEQVATS